MRITCRGLSSAGYRSGHRHRNNWYVGSPINGIAGKPADAGKTTGANLKRNGLRCPYVKYRDRKSPRVVRQLRFPHGGFVCLTQTTPSRLGPHVEFAPARRSCYFQLMRKFLRRMRGLTGFDIGLGVAIATMAGLVNGSWKWAVAAGALYLVVTCLHDR